jgi:hypothetical protein
LNIVVGGVTRPTESSGRERSEPIIIVFLGARHFTQPTLADLKLGILINFIVPILKEGIKITTINI